MSVHGLLALARHVKLWPELGDEELDEVVRRLPGSARFISAAETPKAATAGVPVAGTKASGDEVNSA